MLCRRRIDGVRRNRIVGPILEGGSGIHLPLSGGREVGFHFEFYGGFGDERGLGFEMMVEGRLLRRMGRRGCRVVVVRWVLLMPFCPISWCFCSVVFVLLLNNKNVVM